MSHWTRSLARSAANSILARKVRSRLLGFDVAAVDIYRGAPAGVERSARLFVEAFKQLRNIGFRELDRHTFSDRWLRHPRVIVWFANSRDLGKARVRFPGLSRDAHGHVGYWYWELGAMPEGEIAQASEVDAIWVATDFIANSLEEQGLTRPAVIPPPIFLDPTLPRSFPGSDRKGARKFLMVFDALSSIERKNPEAAVRAIKEIGGRKTGIHLTIRVSRSDGLDPEILRKLTLLECRNVRLEFRTFDSPRDALRYMSTFDVLVSPHRAEGLGFNIIEAIALGIPVVCTAYGGVSDYCDPRSTDMIGFDMIQGHDPQGLYQGSFEWAEIRHEEFCAALVRAIRISPEDREDRCRRAFTALCESFGTKRILKQIEHEICRLLN